MNINSSSMTSTDQKRTALYEYLCQIFPDRKIPPGMIMTSFVRQVKQDIKGIEMSYGFISAQTKEYEDGWKHEPKANRVTGGSYTAPKLTHDVPDIVENPAEEELIFDSFEVDNSVVLKHNRTGKLIDQILSTHDDLGGLLETVNIQLMAESGVGKTLYAMCMTYDFKNINPDLDILYVQTEMTRVLMQTYIAKAPPLKGVDVLYLRDHAADVLSKVLVNAFNKKKWKLIILDSFQDLIEKLKMSLDMNGTQIEAWLVELMSRMNRSCGTSFIAINHVNKDGSAAGRAYLKHILDGMMEIRRDPADKTKRYITFSKNRVGLDNVSVYYDILREGDERGVKGEIVYDQERYDAINNQRDFLERNKQSLNKQLHHFEELRAGIAVNQDGEDDGD